MTSDKPKFSKAVVRKPGRSLINGLTTANLGTPDYEKALEQHAQYCQALETCGLKVVVLEANEQYPDSTFVEDTALLTPQCAIITNPGAASRTGETADVRPVLERYYENIETIETPGTVEGGDIMMVGPHFYIGLSQRTNLDGAQQMIAILERYGLSGSLVELEKVLHLKTGLAYLENGNLVAAGAFLDKQEFQAFDILAIDDEESYAANCIWVNDKVLIPKGFPRAKKTISQAGYATLEVDVSEFRKLDGGLSCLSLRF